MINPARNTANRMAVIPRLPADTPIPAEIAVSTVNRKIAIRSSMMSTPRTSSVNFPLTRCS